MQQHVIVAGNVSTGDFEGLVGLWKGLMVGTCWNEEAIETGPWGWRSMTLS